MNRRKLLKAISCLVAALVAPFGFVAKSIRAKATNRPENLAVWIEPQNSGVEVYVGSSLNELLNYSPPEVRQFINEEICKLCHRKFKDHSPQELEEHFYNGGGPPKWQPSSSVLP